MKLGETFIKCANAVRDTKKDLESIDAKSKKTVLFRWASMMGKNSDEASKLADRTPDEEGKWEGVKLTERKELLKKIDSAFRG